MKSEGHTSSAERQQVIILDVRLYAINNTTFYINELIMGNGATRFILRRYAHYFRKTKFLGTLKLQLYLRRSSGS